ncbi:TonB family protein [Erythrobacter sp. SDW2]|uniref:energy transducer TonB n=1 Tax=Erythrobacter sp. SDW2 TaxID=2907154 RepID=UPI001F418D44|nr:energy transducer TonB [Erythrobacter sp. SDW2]UIP06409.1 TonB family protein [Erythrobacter sp. SDW2]
MAYVDAAGTNRAPAMIGVAAIHAALAVVVVTGLAGGVAKIVDDDGIMGFPIERPKPTPSPPPPDRPIEDESKSITKIVIPEKPFNLDQSSTEVDATDQQQAYSEPDTTASGNEGIGDGMADKGGSKAKEQPKFKPVPPVARNGNWVTDDDYRSSWVTRRWEGTVGFRLTVGTDGKVKDCTVTQSSGYEALDDATCSLVRKRARFDPGKNDRGETASGNFSSAVRWHIPD